MSIRISDLFPTVLIRAPDFLQPIRPFGDDSVHGPRPPAAEVLRIREYLLKVVPGIRHEVPLDGNWHFSIAAPTFPPNITKPLYYVIRAYYEMGGRTSDPVTVKVYRAE